MNHPSVDAKGRRRTITTTFRMSPEEWKVFDTQVKMAGMSKRDYIIAKLQDRTVVVQPSTRIYKALRDEMRNIYVELLRLRRSQDLDDETKEVLSTLTKMYADLGADELRSKADDLDDRIARLGTD